MRQRRQVSGELKSFDWLHKAESQYNKAAGSSGLIHFMRELHLREMVIGQRVIRDVLESAHGMMMERVVDAMQQVVAHLDQLGHAG